VSEEIVGEQRPPARILVGDLVIRRWRSEDLDNVQRAVSESIQQLRPWLAWANDERSAQAEFLEATALGWEQGERFEYAIEDPQGSLLGSAGLMRRIGPGGLEIGYWVHSAHTRRGIAKLAAAALSAAAFRLPWVDHVEIHHDKENLASGAVPAGLGFQMIEEVYKAPMAAADSGHDLIWRLSRDSYPESRARSLVEHAET
jgi:ribosomal-protein-serine acetyltransferase